LIALGISAEKIQVIYNPADIEEIQKKSENNIEKIFENFPFIINAGRLIKQKGQWHILRILKN